MADFDPFSHGKYWCPYLDERIWTEFSKRIRPGAHRARIPLFKCHGVWRADIYLRTIYFQKNDILYVLPKRSIPEKIAARSRQIAEFEGAGPIQSSPPYHGHIDIFQTDPSQDETNSSFFQFPSSNHVKKPEICPQPKLGSEYNVFSKNALLKNECLLYINKTIYYI